MKILQVTFVRGVAGSENFLLNAISGLKAIGHEVEMLMLYVDQQETESFRKLLEDRQIKWHRMDIRKHRLPGTLMKAARLSRRFDVVNSHLLHADLTMSLAKRFFNRRMVLTSGKHGYEETYINQFGFDPKHKVVNLYYRMSKLAERNTNRSFAISGGIRNLFTGVNITRPENMELIYYGFAFDDQYQFNPELRFGDQQLCIVGRLTAFKGHRFALEALSKLKNEFPGLRLVIVGWGELETELRDQVNRLGLDNEVVFTGFQPNARDYMFSSDVILLPSISEGFGIVLAEAMSVRKPIVAFNVPSPSELLENEVSGLLVPPYDTDLYAAAIRTLLMDSDKADRLAKQAKKVLDEQYHLSGMIAKLEQFYQTAIKNAAHQQHPEKK